ncbi:MAG: indolepyruvate ferredoxin oxidoreductase subunit alpha [Candidatus Bathyarchaeota archaeon]|nr:indolepyruvate ferredoxin oxidoreductase subunit alpha [Candidatus Bathyarchaeota archaeon]
MPDLRVLLADSPGKRVLLLGNEAIARGILEVGVGVVTTYPGTPASEIGDSISEIAAEAGIYMEYSINEIVATEVAGGAANSGVRALTAMKHVGLNVASDFVMTLAYAGVRSGLVIVTADDPECYSSQNEQDNRFYALLANLPCLEPSDSQEAKDMTISAIEISEKLELPVILRTTTRVSHTRVPVVYGKFTKPVLKGEFLKDVKRLVMVPAHSRPKHPVLLKSMEKAKEISETSLYNKITREGKSGKISIISSSAAYNYAVEAADLLGLDVSLMKLGMTHPVPEKFIGKFLEKHEKIIVVEELEPYLELHVKAIAKDYAPNIEIYGKMGKQYFPRDGELSTRIVATGLAKVTGKKLPMNFEKINEKYAEVSRNLPSRPPILCAGCPHRASMYIMKKVGGEKAVYSTDIGCYALGAAPPLKTGDIMTCMGASIGTAQGISKATETPTFAIIGDSTFFHAGIPGLINAVYNNHKIIVTVLDNLTTAMTGHQPHPGTGWTGMHTPTEKIMIEKVAEGCGVKYVKVVNPFKIKEAETVLKEAMKHSGPSVIVFRAPCALMVVRQRRRKGAELLACKITDKCTNCMACVKLLGCPAIIFKEGKVSISETLCNACGLCASVCPYNAIECAKIG